MATASGPLTTQHRAGDILPVALAASVQIYKGAAASVLSGTGYGTPLVTATGTTLFLGVWGETLLEPTGVAGSTFTTVIRKGVFSWPQTGSTISAANIGSNAYFADDSTVTLSSSSTTWAGVIVAVDAAGNVWVDITNAVMQAPVNGKTLAYSYKALAANLGAGNPVTNVAGAAQTAATVSIPANGLTAGNIVRVTGQIVGVTHTASDTVAVTLALGSTTLTLAAAFAHATTNFLWFTVDFTVLTAGASGTTLAAGIVSGGTVGATMLGVSAGSTAIDTTATRAIVLGITFSASNTTDQICVNDFHAEVIN